MTTERPSVVRVGDVVPTSRELAHWRYGYAKGWPEVWSYPTRPKPIPAPEGRAVVAATKWREKAPPPAVVARHEERIRAIDDELQNPALSTAARMGLRAEQSTLIRGLFPRKVDKWTERHTKRRAVCEQLRRAAWYVRRHWKRHGDTWADGPYRGVSVVDPLDIFNRVDDCCQDACMRPTTGGIHGNMAVFAKRCKADRYCEVCAAEDCRQHGERVLVVAGRFGRPGALVHLVLTHRDQDPGARESCTAAWERHERAYQRLRTGKHGRWLARMVYGFAMRLETTNGKTGLTWHPHSHAIVELKPGVTVERFRDELAARWARCTALAAIDMGLVDFAEILNRHRDRYPSSRSLAREAAMFEVEARYGWDRASGWDAKAGRERWCEAVREDAKSIRSAVFQTAKYANPGLATESPARLAEFMQWAQSRKLTRWGGAWAGVEPDRSDPDPANWVDGVDVRGWIDAQCEYNAREHHREEVRKGNRPDLGDLIPGSQATVSLHYVTERRAQGLERIHFDQLGCSRDASALDDTRAWWAMLAEQRTAIYRLRKRVENMLPHEREARGPGVDAFAEALAKVRLMPVADGLARWAEIRAELPRIERIVTEDDPDA
jgi:hypothetical protein